LKTDKKKRVGNISCIVLIDNRKRVGNNSRTWHEKSSTNHVVH